MATEQAVVRQVNAPTSELPTDTTPDFSERPLWFDGLDFGVGTPAVDARATVDVLIIGGGYTGLSAATTTAAAGLSTLVAEAAYLGFGCSARNGGHVTTSVKPNLSQLQARFGSAAGRAILQEGIDALENLRAFVATRGIDCDWQSAGSYFAARSARQLSKMARLAESQSRELDLPALVVSRAEQSREINTDRYYGGVVYPRHASLHPLKLLLALYRIAADNGAQYLERCRVEAIQREPDGFSVLTCMGIFRARKVLIATDGYTGPLSPWHHRRIVPIRSDVIATEPLDAGLMDHLLPSRRTVVEDRKVIVYFRPSPDGKRLVFGGRAAFFEVSTKVAVSRLLRWMRHIFPQLCDTRVSHAWSGVVAFSFDKLPHIGQHDGIHYCMGYCGSGVPLSIHFGKKVGLKILGRPEGKTAIDEIPFITRPFYNGNPWFLAPSILAYRALDVLNL